MTDERNIYAMPNTGCLLGTAYQTLTGRLGEALIKAGLGITVAEYLVLRVLYTADGSRQCDIAAMLGKDKGAVNRCVKGLLAKGLVSVTPVSHKCLRVFLSEEGRRIRTLVMKVAEERHQVLASLVSPAEMKTFTSVLEKIISQK